MSKQVKHKWEIVGYWPRGNVRAPARVGVHYRDQHGHEKILEMTAKAALKMGVKIFLEDTI